MKPRARKLIAAALFGGVACGWTGCAQIFGIDDANAVPDPNDAATLGDSTQATDATSGEDVIDGGAGSDATSSDAPAETCASRVASMLSQPISPTVWGGLDFSLGGTVTDVPGNGGLTMPQTGLLPCADFAEPTTLLPNELPITPGYRTYGFGRPDGGATTAYPFALQANAQSQVIEFVSLESGYTGTLTFNSRPGGAYGNHTYEIAIGVASADGGSAPSGGGVCKARRGQLRRRLELRT